MNTCFWYEFWGFGGGGKSGLWYSGLWACAVLQAVTNVSEEIIASEMLVTNKKRTIHIVITQNYLRNQIYVGHHEEFVKAINVTDLKLLMKLFETNVACERQNYKMIKRLNLHIIKIRHAPSTNTTECLMTPDQGIRYCNLDLQSGFQPSHPELNRTVNKEVGLSVQWTDMPTDVNCSIWFLQGIKFLDARKHNYTTFHTFRVVRRF